MFRKTLALTTLLFLNWCHTAGLAQGADPAPADYFVYIGSYTHPTPTSLSSAAGMRSTRPPTCASVFRLRSRWPVRRPAADCGAATGGGF